MAEDKKYTAKEAAMAVLKKAEQMLKAKKKDKNPDESADAELGEKVEHLVEDHMLDNKDEEKKEGHKIMKDVKKSQDYMFKSEKVAQNTTGLHTVEYVRVDFAEPLEKAEKMKKAKNEIGTDMDKEKAALEKCGSCGQSKPAMMKNENKDAPSNPMKPEVAPSQPQAGESEHPGERVKNEQAQVHADQASHSGNPMWGTIPGKGVQKLGVFLHHSHAKRSKKSGAQNG